MRRGAQERVVSLTVTVNERTHRANTSRPLQVARRLIREGVAVGVAVAVVGRHEAVELEPLPPPLALAVALAPRLALVVALGVVLTVLWQWLPPHST